MIDINFGTVFICMTSTFQHSTPSSFILASIAEWPQNRQDNMCWVKTFGLDKRLRLLSKSKVLTQQELKYGLKRSANPFVLDKSLRQKS